MPSLPNISRPPRKGVVLKVLVAGRGISVRLSPVLLVLLLALGGCLIWQVRAYLQAAHQQYQARIEELEQERSVLRSSLALKEREKNQMLALAGSRSQELWAELQARDKEIEQIWRMVGRKPSSGRTGHRPVQSSRSGGYRSVQVKMNYLRLRQALEKSEADMSRLKVAVADYRRRLEEQRRLAELNATPSIWPCAGNLSSGYGWRIHPVYGYGRFHSGLDITAPYGAPVRATAAGRVVLADYYSGYGLAVIIDHGNGMTTLYGHCSSLATRVGAFVKKGQVIAYVGSTGVSTGPHVHYEVTVNGAQVDPAPYLNGKDPVGSVAKGF